MLLSTPDAVIKVTSISSSAKRKPSAIGESSSSSLYPAAAISWTQGDDPIPLVKHLAAAVQVQDLMAEASSPHC